MAIAVPTFQPDTITVGNSLAFTFNAPDYAPDTYTLTYRIIGLDHTYTLVGADNGDGTHAFSAGVSTTERWQPGTYQYYITATSGADDRYTVAKGPVTLLADPGIGGFDGRSHVKIVLDALEAVIQKKATKDHLKVTIGTRTIEQMSPQDIETWRAQYQAEYARELQAERTAKGLGSPRTIKARIR